MSYIWSKYSRNNVFSLATNGKQFSPFLETSPAVNGNIAVNYLLRFNGVFNQLARIQQEQEYNYDNDAIINTLFHLLANLDMCKGIHKFSLEQQFIEQEILKGNYGENVKNGYLVLNNSERWEILWLINEQNSQFGRRLYFKEAVGKLFRINKIYFTNMEKKLLVFIGEYKTDINMIKMDLLVDLFLDITSEYRVFWGKHFGIIGERRTMQIGKIAIY